MDTHTNTLVTSLYAITVICTGVGLIALNFFLALKLISRIERGKRSLDRATRLRRWVAPAAAGQRTSSLTGSTTFGRASISGLLTIGRELLGTLILRRERRLFGRIGMSPRWWL